MHIYCINRCINKVALALFKQKGENWPVACVVCQEHVVPTDQRELPGPMHQSTHRQHCHHPLQQPHLPHWCHWVEEVTQRHLHFDGWHKNHLCRILQVRQLLNRKVFFFFCVCVCAMKWLFIMEFNSETQWKSCLTCALSLLCTGFLF